MMIYVILIASICLILTIFVVYYETMNHITANGLIKQKLHEKNLKPSIIHNELNHCYFNVLGLHHSGTGISEQVLIDSFVDKDQVSFFKDTGKAQDEGQHLQTVFPNAGKRKQFNCGRNNDNAIISYFCPKFLLNINSMQQKQILKDWSTYWQMDRKFLIEKTPTLDAAILNKLIPNSIQIIVLRHPFFWRYPKAGCKYLDKQKKNLNHLPSITQRTQQLTNCAAQHFKIFSHLFTQLQNNLVDNYIIVRYEDLIMKEPIIIDELQKFNEKSCSLFTKPKQNKNRILEVREKGNYDPKLVWDEILMNLWKECLKIESCITVLKNYEPAANALGYSFINESNPILDNNRIITYSSVIAKENKNDYNNQLNNVINILNNNK